MYRSSSYYNVALPFSYVIFGFPLCPFLGMLQGVTLLYLLYSKVRKRGPIEVIDKGQSGNSILTPIST